MLLLVYEKQLALFEAFRRLGFSADAIFVGHNGGFPIVVVKAQGKQFVVTVDVPAPADEGEYIEGWCAAAAAWNKNTLGEAERKRIFDEHILHAGISVPLVTALVEKGFALGSVNLN